MAAKRHKSVESLRCSLKEAWRQISQNTLRAAMKAYSKCPRAGRKEGTLSDFYLTPIVRIYIDLAETQLVFCCFRKKSCWINNLTQSSPCVSFSDRLPNHSTSGVKERLEIERNLLSDARIFQIFIDIYYYDYVVFGYQLPKTMLPETKSTPN